MYFLKKKSYDNNVSNACMIIQCAYSPYYVPKKKKKRLFLYFEHLNAFNNINNEMIVG